MLNQVNPATFSDGTNVPPSREYVPPVLQPVGNLRDVLAASTQLNDGDSAQDCGTVTGSFTGC